MGDMGATPTVAMVDTTMGTGDTMAGMADTMVTVDITAVGVVATVADMAVGTGVEVIVVVTVATGMAGVEATAFGIAQIAMVVGTTGNVLLNS